MTVVFEEHDESPTSPVPPSVGGPYSVVGPGIAPDVRPDTAPDETSRSTPTDASTDSPERPDGRPDVVRSPAAGLLRRLRFGRWPRRARRHRRASHRAQRFWLVVELQLEAARRHERTFSVSMFPGRHDERTLDEISASIRRTDAAGLIDGDLVVLWSETDERHLHAAIRRVAAVVRSDLTSVVTVEYPRDGLTAASLFDSLTATPSPPPDPIPPRPWTST